MWALRAASALRSARVGFARLGFARLGAAALAACSLVAPLPAHAFCRSTTCTSDCERDADGCKVTGLPLAWPTSCVGFSLQRDGTEFLPLPETKAAIEDGFYAWTDLPCDGGTASLSFSPLAEATCREAQYVGGGPNANVVLFQDTKWDYAGVENNLAKTTVTFDRSTGTILDADIELNHAYNELTLGDDGVVYDLRSIVTHEIGHFIGLDHAPDPSATMYAGYDVGSIEQRTLEADDVAAVCAAYPPDRAAVCNPIPQGGLADACAGGCSLSPPAPRPHEGALLTVGAALALTVLRRRPPTPRDRPS